MTKSNILELIYYNHGKIVTAQELLQRELSRRVSIEETEDIVRKNIFITTLKKHAKKG